MGLTSLMMFHRNTSYHGEKRNSLYFDKLARKFTLSVRHSRRLNKQLSHKEAQARSSSYSSLQSYSRRVSNVFAVMGAIGKTRSLFRFGLKRSLMTCRNRHVRSEYTIGLQALVK